MFLLLRRAQRQPVAFAGIYKHMLGAISASERYVREQEDGEMQAMYECYEVQPDEIPDWSLRSTIGPYIGQPLMSISRSMAGDSYVYYNPRANVTRVYPIEKN